MTHLIIAGHGWQRNGTFDPGASGHIKKGEHKYVVEDLFPAIRKHLPKGHNVVLFSKYKVSNYGNIVALAKEYNATQITEIHFDAAAAESARGGHVIVYKGYSPDKTDLALRDVIKKMVGVRYSHKGHEGISGRDNLLNVNLTARAGITYRLLELGFGSNKRDADILVNQVDQYAKELVKAITGKVSDKPTNQASKPKPSTPSKPSKPTDPSKDDDIKVDGLFGPDTARKAQKVYGLKVVDGIVSGQPKNASTQNIPSAQFGSSGSALIYEMQKEFGVPAKYRDGKITVPSMLVGRMQKHYGTTIDNVLSKPSLVIMEWQKALNKGKRK